MQPVTLRWVSSKTSWSKLQHAESCHLIIIQVEARGFIQHSIQLRPNYVIAMTSYIYCVRPQGRWISVSLILLLWLWCLLGAEGTDCCFTTEADRRDTVEKVWVYDETENCRSGCTSTSCPGKCLCHETCTVDYPRHSFLKAEPANS